MREIFHNVKTAGQILMQFTRYSVLTYLVLQVEQNCAYLTLTFDIERKIGNSLQSFAALGHTVKCPTVFTSDVIAIRQSQADTGD